MFGVLSLLSQGRKRWRRYRLLVLGIGIVGGNILCALFAPYLVPYDPYTYNPRAVLLSPSLTHLLGTDPLGRDIFSQIIYGARISLSVGIISVAAGLVLGTGIGLVSGMRGGRVDNLLMRVMDALLVFPALVLALTITAFLGVSLWNAILALGVIFIPSYARLVRGQVLSLREREFIISAKALGARDHRIMLRHLLPNLFDLLAVQAAYSVGTAILTEASLSFLGLGVPPPALSWGRILREGYSYLQIAPWISIASGTAIFLVVWGFQLLADGLRDLLYRVGD
jgi:ABC-type dipeptide/oligopeptide/nickel transport system permease subunit